MGHSAPTDHLELWRGIDDAVWREALRPPVRAAAGLAIPLAKPTDRAPHPVVTRVPEPA